MDPNTYQVSVHEILPGIFLGNQATSQSERFMVENKIDLVINCTKHLPSKFLGKIRYLRVPVNDPGLSEVHNEDTLVMQRCLPLVGGVIHAFRKKGKKILIHCHAGMQRSAIVAAYYLYASGEKPTWDKAIAEIIRIRPIAFQGGKSINFYPVTKQ